MLLYDEDQQLIDSYISHERSPTDDYGVTSPYLSKYRVSVFVPLAGQINKTFAIGPACILIVAADRVASAEERIVHMGSRHLRK